MIQMNVILVVLHSFQEFVLENLSHDLSQVVQTSGLGRHMVLSCRPYHILGAFMVLPYFRGFYGNTQVYYKREAP